MSFLKGKRVGGLPVFFPTSIFLLIVLFTSGCTLNNPYRSAERAKNILYTTFIEPPKHLDPGRSYSSDEYAIIGQIYEPPLQYHYLKRPYELTPLTATGVPVPAYFGRDGEKLPPDAPPDRVFKAVYEIKIKKGIYYQDHPAFARDADGKPLYLNLTKKDLSGIEELKDFPSVGARELTSDDYIFQIKRLADPLIESPILPILEKYILGLEEYSGLLKKDIEEIRKERKEAIGAAYNQTMDEAQTPIVPPYDKHPFPGVQKVDSYTFRITLKKKYPQFLYWLAMPFFSPMPEEAVLFYKQGPLVDKNITLNRYPVGTGPYMMEVYNPNMEIILAKNRNYRDDRYPEEGANGDLEAGLLDDAGSKLPFVEKVVFKLEKEAIPRWSKFLQGYYDNSGITAETFDQAVTLGAAGEAEVTATMKEKGIRLLTSVLPSTYYGGFNMLDDVVGGYSPEKQKLRQAISIALDYEEYIEIFNNGRGIPGHSPLPPGIFGYLTGEEGVNPYVYDWDQARKRPARRSIEYAKRLMEEAGYRGGRDSRGRPLVITFDNPWTGPEFTPVINWYIKRFKLLGIQLENRTTDYNRFQEKMMAGNFQFFAWGWNADYPDPENFFFLLTGPNSKVKYQGENVSNYSNVDFDRLFRKMENMDNTTERLEIIKEMTRIAQKDSPWVFGYHPVAFTLYHSFVGNVKPNAMANNTMKYVKLDPVLRDKLRVAWNRPLYWPVLAAFAFLVIIALPALISIKRKREGKTGA